MPNVNNSKFDPEVHFNHKKPWMLVDENYLIKYHKDKRINLSLALGRTYKSILDRIHNLKKKGKISG